MLIKEINIKSQTYDYFDNLIKRKKSKAENILITKKEYEDLLIYFIRYNGGK